MNWKPIGKAATFGIAASALVTLTDWVGGGVDVRATSAALVWAFIGYAAGFGAGRREGEAHAR